MNLEQAAQLLQGEGDHARFFELTYKIYKFTGEHTLQEYLEFVDHDTVEWMRGFPANLNVKVKFAKPKTALIKLLKKPEVAAALGDTFVKQVHQKVWDTFKQQGDAVLAERCKEPHIEVVESEAHTYDESIEAESVGSEILEEVPTLLWRSRQSKQSKQSCQTQQNQHQSVRTDEERIILLKSALTAMAELLPAGASDAFCQLVAFV